MRVPVLLAALTVTVGACTGVVRAGDSSAPIAIVCGKAAHPAERMAARELGERLQRMYPAQRFVAADEMPRAGEAIVVASLQSNTALVTTCVQPNRLAQPESFVVTHRRDAARSIAIIAGADARGASHGVYALLEKLGCGFYLSYETLPRGAEWPGFVEWELADTPRCADRIVFNWHNFLSSASTWDFGQWRQYIDAAVRMRFNDLMVHAYGNNPMFTFQFNGRTKPVGYLATTRSGRDWGTQHVNDVRRLIGGELFSDAVFGAEVAKVDGAQRVAAATDLMKRVFAHARSRGLGITFALDVDTASATPQDLIGTLPPAARIVAGEGSVANPDTPQGNAYYKAQVQQLLALYPEITRLAVWFRAAPTTTPWQMLKREDLPASWRQAFSGPDEEVRMFGLGQVVRAFGRALKEIGRGDVELGAGSWRFDFLESADRLLPGEATLLPLDWSLVFDTPAGQRQLHQVRRGRKLVPIIWAHHDDHTYIGRCRTPYVNFATLLRRSGASGFGIIHWTTRPLDLFFKSAVTQVWQATEDQPLEQACEHMAMRSFGAAAQSVGGEYLFSWVTEAPMFGRETSSRFMDRPLPTPELHLKLGRQRIARLEKIDRNQLPADGAARLAYFRGYEEFMLSFFESHGAYERAAEAFQRGDYARARKDIARVDAEKTIRAYVDAARTGGISRGEEALVVSLNLRWLPYVLSLRQALGLEPARHRLGVVEREPLAQGPGSNTFFVDENRQWWKVLDEATLPAALRLGGIMGDQLEPGRYAIGGRGEADAKDGRVEVPRPAELREIVISRMPAAR